MTINDQIRDWKLQYNINREAAKISALSSGKIYKYEYLSSEYILPSNQIIEQAKFLKKKQKTNKDNRRSRRKTNKSNSRSGTS